MNLFKKLFHTEKTENMELNTCRNEISNVRIKIMRAKTSREYEELREAELNLKKNARLLAITKSEKEELDAFLDRNIIGMNVDVFMDQCKFWMDYTNG